MLDIKFIRENPEKVRESIKDRGLKVDINELLKLDEQRRKLLIETEDLKAKKNKLSDEVASLKRENKPVDVKLTESKALSQKIKDFDTKVEEIEQKIASFLYDIPNIPDNSVPRGKTREENKMVRSWGKQYKFSHNPRNHIELSENLGIIDFPRSAKVSGSNFSLFFGDGARLQRALINFMLDLHATKHGYKEVWPPALVNRPTMTTTGQLPKFEEDMYRLKDDDLFLIPTAEVPLTNMHRDEILNEDALPIYYTAYTPCFRREAGSYGKDTKGLIRVHQFDKIELVKFTKPQDSDKEHEKLLNDAEEVLQLLELPYRIMLLCAGELSFSASKCYDIEAYAPGTDAWLEVSSCSNFTDFQARRGNIKYRDKTTKKLNYVHTLNGSGVALARLVVCILENYQDKDGNITVPAALRPYMDGRDKITPV